MRPEIREAFSIQEDNCRRMGSPFTAALCAVLPRVLDPATALGGRVHGWTEDPVASALALRLCGALHRVVRAGEAPALAALYPPAGAGPELLEGALADTLGALDGRLADLIATPPQTNEIGRAAAYLGGLFEIARGTGLPLALLEIGASAGLNLHLDRFSYDLGGSAWAAEPAEPPIRIASDWRGAPPAPAPIRIAARAGCDRAPIDPADTQDRARLMAFIWPDQPHRLERTEAALALAARLGAPVERRDAADWVEARLAGPAPEGVARVLMHSVMWQYLDPPTKARIRAAMDRAGSEATAAAPLAWLHLERDATPGSAAVTLTLWPGGTPRLLARADYHGAWIDWLADPPALAAPAPG